MKKFRTRALASGLAALPATFLAVGAAMAADNDATRVYIFGPAATPAEKGPADLLVQPPVKTERPAQDARPEPSTPGAGVSVVSYVAVEADEAREVGGGAIYLPR